ncbi:hypothetical protein ACEWF1_09865 [Bifidobacterium longum subsp. longum]
MSNSYRLPPNVNWGFDTGPNQTISNGIGAGIGFTTVVFLAVGI